MRNVKKLNNSHIHCVILYYKLFYYTVSADFVSLFIKRDSRNLIHSLVVLPLDAWVSLICVCLVSFIHYVLPTLGQFSFFFLISVSAHDPDLWVSLCALIDYA